jgi:hypothetical protein
MDNSDKIPLPKRSKIALFSGSTPRNRKKPMADYVSAIGIGKD